jgi:hypothetical protein
MIPIWYLLVGTATGICMFLDFILHCFDGKNKEWENYNYFLIGSVGVLFILIDIFLWPLYIICKINEWFWSFRKNIKF